MSHHGKSPRSALSESLLGSNSPREIAIDIPRPERSSIASAPGVHPDSSWHISNAELIAHGIGVM